MSSIVYRTDPKSGAQYAYRSESYRDPITHKPRNRKEYLGRVDPETGEIIPKKSRVAQAMQATDVASAGASDEAAVEDATIAALTAELASTRAERDALVEALSRISSEIEAVLAAIGDPHARPDVEAWPEPQ